MITTQDVIGHFAGDTDPRNAAGFLTLTGAVRGAKLLTVIHELSCRAEGPLVLGCLRTFHDPMWATTEAGPYRALAEVFVWMCALDERPCLEAKDLSDRWRRGEESETRSEAAEFYADCLLALDRWLAA